MHSITILFFFEPAWEFHAVVTPEIQYPNFKGISVNDLETPVDTQPHNKNLGADGSKKGEASLRRWLRKKAK